MRAASAAIRIHDLAHVVPARLAAASAFLAEATARLGNRREGPAIVGHSTGGPGLHAFRTKRDAGSERRGAVI